MGFWSGLFTATKGTHKAVSSTIAGPVGEGAGMVSKAVGHTLGAAGTVTGGTIGATTGLITGVLAPFKRPLKWGGAIVGLGIITGVAAHYLRKDKHKDQPIANVIPEMAPPMPTMDAMPNTMMGMAPVEGKQAQAIKDQRAAMGGQQLG